MSHALIIAQATNTRLLSRATRKGDTGFTGSRTRRGRTGLARRTGVMTRYSPGMSLESALRNGSFDMVIPVRGTSVSDSRSGASRAN